MNWRPGGVKERSGVNCLHGMTSLMGLAAVGTYVTDDSCDWVTIGGTGHAWGYPTSETPPSFELSLCLPHILTSLFFISPESSSSELGKNIGA